MSCDRMEERLHDYVDGYLFQKERLDVERHLGECASCRQEAEEIRALLRSVAGLPREILPPADLWSVTSAAARTSPAPGRRGAAARRIRPMMAAAAAVVLIATAAVTLLLVRGRGEQAPAAVASTPREALAAGTLMVDIEAAEAEFRRATAQLLKVLERHRGELPPGTLQALDENLEKIDEAIADARAALERDPENPRLGHLVTAVHKRKFDMLREAVRLAAPL